MTEHPDRNPDIADLKVKMKELQDRADAIKQGRWFFVLAWMLLAASLLGSYRETVKWKATAERAESIANECVTLLQK